MSTFYSDGYQDAIHGLESSPPDIWTQKGGYSTTVFALEYEEGYTAGKLAIQTYITTPIKQPNYWGEDTFGGFIGGDGLANRVKK